MHGMDHQGPLTHPSMTPMAGLLDARLAQLRAQLRTDSSARTEQTELHTDPRKVQLLTDALNAAGIDALASTPDFELVNRVLHTHQGRELLADDHLDGTDEPLAEWERELANAGEAVQGDGHGNEWDANGNQVATETITSEAERAVYGDRHDDYGHPREDFTRTAIIWTGLLQHKLADGEHITPEDMARCMIGVKLARDVHRPKRDNRVDGAGYWLTLDRLETGK